MTSSEKSGRATRRMRDASRILAFTVEPKRRLHLALDFEGNIDGRAAERRATCVQSDSMR